MELNTHRSRWSARPKLGPDGRPEPFQFVPSDLDICKLLAFGTSARLPWAYEYLPTSYFAPLLLRGERSVPKRIRKLCDWGYLAKPDQPKSNHREIVYALAKRGADEIRGEGLTVPRLARRQLAHQLMACLIAASFELASLRRPNVAIATGGIDTTNLGIVPDWPPFRLTTPRCARAVFIEADVGSETLAGHDAATTIADKLDRYLDRIHDGRLRNAVILFVTTRSSRMDSMVELLKRVIDRNGYPHDFAEPFAFAHITYDRFMSCTPTLTDWAVTGSYQRAGFPPFNFLDP